MEFIAEELQAYIEAHSKRESTLLQKINRDTYAEVLSPRMLSGHLQGRVLSMLAHMIKPKSVLEIGTYTGYSAICISEGLAKGGKITTIDINKELEDRTRGYFKEAELENAVDYRIGNALEIIPSLKMKFDFVFIDADKISYPAYYDLVVDRVQSGGFIIADNVLWSGKVLEENLPNKDKDTPAIVKFNKSVHEDERVENVLFPIRDGLMILRKL